MHLIWSLVLIGIGGLVAGIAFGYFVWDWFPSWALAVPALAAYGAKRLTPFGDVAVWVLLIVAPLAVLFLIRDLFDWLGG